MTTSSKLNAIIVEDEPLARKRLNRLLQPYADFIQIIGEATNGIMGLEMINNLKPDLVFLDVEMPGMNGIELLENLKHTPKIVFTTAFEHYALKAFEENSIDYLLKPIEAKRLEKTISRLKDLSSSANIAVDDLIKKISGAALNTKPSRISVRLGDRHILLNWEDIGYLEAKDKMIFVNTLDGRSLPGDLPLSAIEEIMPLFFSRVHRAFIINTKAVIEVRNGFNSTYHLLLNDLKGTKIKSSRSYISVIKEQFGI